MSGLDLYSKMLAGQITSSEYAEALKAEVRQRCHRADYEQRWHEDEKSRPRISREAKENLCLTAIAVGSIIGLAMTWWLS